MLFPGRSKGLTTRTLAPKARGGRLWRNLDFTTPPEPCGRVTRLRGQQVIIPSDGIRATTSKIVVPPDHPNFRSLDFPLGFIHIGDTLIKAMMVTSPVSSDGSSINECTTKAPFQDRIEPPLCSTRPLSAVGRC